MKHIIGAFGTLIVLGLQILICTSVTSVSGVMAEAKEYKASVIAEIENSNFNQNVIDACIRQAGQEGYILEITNCIYDADMDMQSAEVLLSYEYAIQILGIKDIRTTRGIAR